MISPAPMSGCAACAAVPLAQSVAKVDVSSPTVILSLPDIHCAACISGVERALSAIPGVKAARVNLSLKRVSIDAPDMAPELLVDVLGDAGYLALPLDASMLSGADKDAKGQALLLRLAVAGFAMMNVMLFSVAVWSGASAATQVMFHWLSAGIAVPALLFSAQVFVSSAWSALRVGRLNMDVPISLAIILAAGLSVYETIEGGADVYFDAALSLTFFLLVGRYLDHRTRMVARSASQELSALETPRAIRVQAGVRQNVNVSDLRVGDTLLIPAGMRVPVDGIVRDGASDLDQSLLTGESLPVSVSRGEPLVSGAMNLSAPLTIEVTATGQDTTLRRMAALVETAEGARNRYTALADRAARIYAPAVHLLALITFVGWILLSGDGIRALNVAISVLIITCPCALGLAVPAVMTAATGRLFRRGMLVKDGTALERLAEVDAVVFDKTGTLTTGRVSLNTSDLNADAMAVLAALSGSSNHPVAQAISAAIAPNVTPEKLENLREYPGLGVQATWRGSEVRLGQAAWVGAQISPALRIGDNPALPLMFLETLRDGALDSVRNLADLELDPQILSGDTQSATMIIAGQLGDIPARGDLRPDEKSNEIFKMTQDGKKVLMVGDGLNDTAALAQAYASISPASALDASRAASDIVLLGQSLQDIPDAISLARSARKRVIENFAIAAGYNMIAIPVAVLGFATPLAAAIAMSASSITVLLNALRVR
ncbi:MAG: heavy metal translocating P-type ATPase [Sulfitobacter sp.]